MPNYFENQLSFDSYLANCHEYRLYLEQGANITHPGPFGALEDHLKLIASDISRKFTDMLQDFKVGKIELALYKRYLLMYHQRLLTVHRFYTVPELNLDLIQDEIKSHLPKNERLQPI